MNMIERLKLIKSYRENGDTWQVIAAELGWKDGHHVSTYYQRNCDKIDEAFDMISPSYVRDESACNKHLEDLREHHQPGAGELKFVGHEPLMTGHSFQRELNYSVTGSHF